MKGLPWPTPTVLVASAYAGHQGGTVYRIDVSDIAVELARAPVLVRDAVESLYGAIETDPWAIGPAVEWNSRSALRRQTIVADRERWELWILVVDWDVRVDLVRLRRMRRGRGR